MDADEFRKRGREMIDYVADYLENIRSRRPLPEVEPGYLRILIPDHAPEEGEKWEDLFKDIERVIMPGVTHWQHPDFHGYYPALHSYEGTLADILSNGIGTIGLSWASSPACTELEVSMMDWLGKLLKLPEEFLFCSGGNGGGAIMFPKPFLFGKSKPGLDWERVKNQFYQSSASESTMMALLLARARAIVKMKQQQPDMDDNLCMAKFVAYCSDQANSSVQKAGLIAAIKMRVLETDENESFRGNTLREEIDTDKSNGLVPIFVCATLGTTPSCAFDNIQELGEICKEEGIWMHIDAAYAGSAFICPEFRPLLNRVENAESFNFSPHKWLRGNLDCSAMWVKDSTLIVDTFNINPVYLQHENQGQMLDYRHWNIPLGRKFRSLKLWFVLRLCGLKKLQECIRKDVRLAKEFEEMVKSDQRFEIYGKVTMGIACFKLKSTNEDNEKLLKAINADRRIHLTPAVVKETYILRFVICAERTESSDVQKAWDVIQEITAREFPNLK